MAREEKQNKKIRNIVQFVEICGKLNLYEYIHVKGFDV